MLATTRRKVLGTLMLGAGATLGACGFSAQGESAARRGAILLNRLPEANEGLRQAVNFPLIEAIHGRRSRRFARGASLPAGPLKYASKNAPSPLSELQQTLLLATVSGNTGWSNLIPYNRHYLPNIPNYAGAACGRTFPSAAGFHTTELFFTDDAGSYFFPTGNMAPVDEDTAPEGATDLAAYLQSHRSRIRKLGDSRLHLPAAPEHMEMHNDWCANVPGSTLIVPVSDVAQHLILTLCYLVQNGACVYDDINSRAIPGMQRFAELVDTQRAYPLSVVEQGSLTEVTVESSTACYAGALMLQAMGLGGWMYNGLNSLSILGASGDPDVPGLGFRYDTHEKWPLPNVTGLDGVMEGHCPPHFADMRAAVLSVVAKKFGADGPFHAGTPGPYKDNRRVRGSAVVHNDVFIDCVATMAQYVYDTFGRFPATVPSIYAMMYLQAHKLDTDFYDKYFSPGAYLHTHASHEDAWK